MGQICCGQADGSGKEVGKIQSKLLTPSELVEALCEAQRSTTVHQQHAAINVDILETILLDEVVEEDGDEDRRKDAAEFQAMDSGDFISMEEVRIAGVYVPTSRFSDSCPVASARAEEDADDEALAESVSYYRRLARKKKPTGYVRPMDLVRILEENSDPECEDGSRQFKTADFASFRRPQVAFVSKAKLRKVLRIIADDNFQLEM